MTSQIFQQQLEHGKHSVFFLGPNSKCLICAKLLAGDPISSEDSGGGVRGCPESPRWR